MNHFREFCEAKETPFNACPPEARTKMNSITKPGNESLKEELAKRYGKIWEDADENKDGCLNEAEWCVYNKLMLEASLEIYGWAPEFDEAVMKQGYQTLTSFTQHDERGVTKESLIPYTKVAYTVRREYEAAGKWIP